MKACLLQKPLNGSNLTAPVPRNLPQDSKYRARLRLRVWDLNLLQQRLSFYSAFEQHLTGRGPALQWMLRAPALGMKSYTYPRESFVGVSEELRPFDGITFRINFKFSFLNLHYFRGKRREIFPAPPPKKNHEVSPPRLLSIFFSLKFPQICEIVASADIVLRQKYLFPGKLVSGEDIFDQL